MSRSSNRRDIDDDIPYKDAPNGAGSAGAHSGGRIRFGPDRFLYVTTGDNYSATLLQDLKRLGGKVLRLNRDGTAAPGIARRPEAILESSLMAIAMCTASSSDRQVNRTRVNRSPPSMGPITAMKSLRWSRVEMQDGIRRIDRGCGAPTTTAATPAIRGRCR
jgi:Glucose / Sorbosone dehydrogenase